MSEWLRMSLTHWRIVWQSMATCRWKTRRITLMKWRWVEWLLEWTYCVLSGVHFFFFFRRICDSMRISSEIVRASFRAEKYMNSKIVFKGHLFLFNYFRTFFIVFNFVCILYYSLFNTVIHLDTKWISWSLSFGW